MKNFFFILLSFLLVSSCSKNDSEEEEKVALTVISVYAIRDNQLDTQPDCNAQVFVFYDCAPEDFDGCDIRRDGTVTKGNNLVRKANLQGVTDKEGKIRFTMDTIKNPYMVFVMSNQSAGQVMGKYQYNLQKPVEMTFRFLVDP